MKGFKLFLYSNSTIPETFLFSEYNEDTNNAITFNENLVENENSQYTLTFSIANSISSRFPSDFNITRYLRIGRRLKLECENHDGDNYIDFIITSISPEGKTDNIIYNITATDYASFIFSRNNIGLTFDSIEDAEWQYSEQIEPNIENLGDYILERGSLQKNTYTTIAPSTTAIDFSSSPSWSSYTYTYTPPAGHDEAYSFIISHKYDNNFNTQSNTVSKVIELNENKTINFKITRTRKQFFYTLAYYTWNYTITRNGGVITWQANEDYYGGPGFDISENTDYFYSVSSGDTREIQYAVKTINEITVVLGDPLDPADYTLSLDKKHITFNRNFGLLQVIRMKYIVDDTLIKNEGNPITTIEVIRNEYTHKDFLEGWRVIDTNSTPTKFNISLSDSNTYNGLIEISNLTENYIDVNYKNKLITYRAKNSSFYDKNYQLSPNINLQSLSLEYNGDEFYTLMFVEGGQDEYDFNVGLTPTLPDSFINYNWSSAPKVTTENWLNNDYYTKIWEFKPWDTILPTEEEKLIANENFIQLIDRIPYLDNFLINLDYFKNNNILIENNDYEVLFDLVFNDMRLINVEFQGLFRKANNLLYEISQTENEFEQNAEFLVKATGNDYKKYIDLIGDNLTSREPSINYSSKQVFTDTLFNDAGVWKFTALGSTFVVDSINFPAVINGSTFTVSYSGGSLSIPSGDYSINELGYNVYLLSVTAPYMGGTPYQIEYKRKFNIDSTTTVFDNLIYLEENNSTLKRREPSSYKWVKTVVTDQAAIVSELPDASLTYYNQTSVVNKSYWLETQNVIGETWSWEEHKMVVLYKTVYKYYACVPIWDTWTDLTITSQTQSFLVKLIKISYRDTISDLIKTWTYFNNIKEYSGIEGIEEKVENYKNRLKDLILERNLLYQTKLENQAKLSSTTVADDIKDLEATIALNEKELESYTALCGDWEYSEIADSFLFNQKDANGMKIYTYPGKYGVIWNEYSNYAAEYIAQAGTPPLETETIKYRLAEVEKEKRDLWYDIKKTYGHYLIEGYYSNETETDPINLYNQALLYMEKYKTPSENYSISYLDSSDIIGKDIDAIAVGDNINILKAGLGIFMDTPDYKIQVVSISRKLREKNNISLTVNQVRTNDKIIEQILKRI